ncbi:hypothetical protein DOY81_000893 [Sarcophaga bullata]|nr:hypothetical protein DOY81_000893 [Sarcophaga bullata]
MTDRQSASRPNAIVATAATYKAKYTEKFIKNSAVKKTNNFIETLLTRIGVKHLQLQCSIHYTLPCICKYVRMDIHTYVHMHFSKEQEHHKK